MLQAAKSRAKRRPKFQGLIGGANNKTPGPPPTTQRHNFLIKCRGANKHERSEIEAMAHDFSFVCALGSSTRSISSSSGGSIRRRQGTYSLDLVCISGSSSEPTSPCLHSHSRSLAGWLLDGWLFLSRSLMLHTGRMQSVYLPWCSCLLLGTVALLFFLGMCFSLSARLEEFSSTYITPLLIKRAPRLPPVHPASARPRCQFLRC